MNAYDNIELFGMNFNADAMPEVDEATAANAVSDAFDNLYHVMKGTTLEMFDAQPILWGFVNVFHSRARRIASERLHMETRARDLIDAQDGSEIASGQLEDVQREMERAESRETALEYMREQAATLYKEAIGDVWVPISGSRKNPRPTASMIDARDYLRAKAAHDAERLAPKGTRVAIAGGMDFMDVGAVFDALDRARDRIGDMVLIHGGGAKGVDRIATTWAEQRNIPQILFRPDFNRDKKAAPFRRNDKMLAEKPRAVVIFPGNGITENLAQKAEQAKIIVWRPKVASANSQQGAQHGGEAQGTQQSQQSGGANQSQPPQDGADDVSQSRASARNHAPAQRRREQGPQHHSEHPRTVAARRSEAQANHGRGKLSASQRADIARHVLMANKTRARVARLYDVSTSTVSRIVNEAKVELASQGAAGR